jgi:choline dehydrogenase-like flavoprotein
MDNRYDVIIIGTGAGGGTLAYHLAPSGKRILLLERGGYLPREKDNWESRAVFVESKYRAKETWYDKDGKPFSPGIQYYVGGNTKVYGAALLRFREQDFGEVRHHGGISPAWPLSYQDFEPYYTGRSTFIMSTGSAVSIRRRVRLAHRIFIRRSAASCAFRSCSTISGGLAITRSLCRSASCLMKRRERRCTVVPVYDVPRLTDFHAW